MSAPFTLDFPPHVYGTLPATCLVYAAVCLRVCMCVSVCVLNQKQVVCLPRGFHFHSKPAFNSAVCVCKV